MVLKVHAYFLADLLEIIGHFGHYCYLLLLYTTSPFFHSVFSHSKNNYNKSNQRQNVAHRMPFAHFLSVALTLTSLLPSSRAFVTLLSLNDSERNVFWFSLSLFFCSLDYVYESKEFQWINFCVLLTLLLSTTFPICNWINCRLLSLFLTIVQSFRFLIASLLTYTFRWFSTINSYSIFLRNLFHQIIILGLVKQSVSMLTKILTCYSTSFLISKQINYIKPKEKWIKMCLSVAELPAIWFSFFILCFYFYRL